MEKAHSKDKKIVKDSTEKPEKKEQIKIQEVLNSAIKKLEAITAKLEAGSRERARAEHTLSSLKGSLERLGKDGAPKGKYNVAVEAYPGNPQPAYVQNEGVPVDELIDILRNQAKEINKDLPTEESLTKAKNKVQSLWEQYNVESEQIEKAIKYSKWEEAKKKYEKAQELRATGYIQKAKELDDLADELYKNSKGYFEAHYTKAHGEGGPWTKEEQEKQDLRTRHEAKLLSLDYRATGSVETDYQAAMAILKYRRELNLAEQEQTDPTPPPVVVVPPEEPPIVDPLPPEEPPVVVVPPPKPDFKKPEKLIAVEAKDLVEFLARERGAKLLNEKLNQAGWVKRKWTQMWEPAYRAMFIEQERKKILGKENKPSWFKRTFFGAKEGAAGQKNLMAGTGQGPEGEAELKA